MSDKIAVEIIRSAGKDCLSIDDNIVSGPWVGQGRTVQTFRVDVADLERILAEHKAKEPSHD